MARTFNELSQVTFTVRPVDKDGDLFTPTTAKYRVDDLDSKAELVAWTTLTPSTEMTVTVPGSAHDIKQTSRRRERKVLTVKLDDGLSSEHNEQQIYWIRNLHFAQVA